MPKSVHAIRNQYRGINAHLHSRYQAEGGWSGFHTRHIVHLADVLAAELLPMGYTAELEESLQIRRLGDVPRNPQADILVYDMLPARPAPPHYPTLAQHIPIPELLAENELSEKPFRAITIRPVEIISRRAGEPVVWIELLSPSNKGSTEDADAYRAKRMNLLVGGLVFVEIDYLHETPPTFPTIPRYRPDQQSTHAYPYHVIIIDPRPSLEDGTAQVVGFGVDQSLPVVEIPLNGSDKLAFDFGEPYRKTFEDGLIGSTLDYSQLPDHFDRYTPADQAKIAARMLAVLQAARTGANLEHAPFAVEDVELSQALDRITNLANQD